MNYLNVYYKRINHMGDTVSERIRNGGIRSFEKWMSESPHTIRHLAVERGIHFDGIILTDKDKSYQKIMYLNVSNEIPIQIGDIMDWKQDNGSIEKWILLQEEKKVNGTYRTFWIVKCNYLLKWIDSNGHLQQSWSYTVSSIDSKIKGNFRTWNNLITPQPNKYAEILMPRFPIDRATNFIVEDESWSVIEYDYTSVPGVIYLSLTENKVNLIYDDLENDIADIDKLANYSVAVPAEAQCFDLNTIINPVYTLMKNGMPISRDVIFSSSDKTIVKMTNEGLVGIKEGECNIIATLKDNPEISVNIPVKITSEEYFSAYIDGPENLRLDRKAIYTLIGTTNIGEVSFSINNNIAKIISVSGNQCEIQANNKNELGIVTLTAEYNSNVYTKEIKVIPLW